MKLEAAQAGRRWSAALALVSFVFASCGDSGGRADGRVPDANPSTDAAPADAADSADAATDGPELSSRPRSYAAVVDIFERSCAYIRCHAGTPVGGMLSLARGEDHARALVDVPACQYGRMKRVEPHHPERSWIWVKLTAPFRDSDDPYANYILFDPAPDWDPNDRGCRDQTDDGTPLFGQRMPLTAPNMLAEAELEAIRSWIAEGAPH